MARKPSQSEAETYESLVAAIEEQLARLESGELTLEESLAAYEAGVAALKKCHALLTAAEGRIEMVMKSADAESADPEAPLAEYDPETGAAKRKATKRGNEPAPEADAASGAGMF